MEFAAVRVGGQEFASGNAKPGGGRRPGLHHLCTRLTGLEVVLERLAFFIRQSSCEERSDLQLVAFMFCRVHQIISRRAVCDDSSRFTLLHSLERLAGSRLQWDSVISAAQLFVDFL
jgi:hypothetical protein